MPVPGPGCWLWTGSNNQRYGIVSRLVNGKRRQMRAHRFAFELFVGPIPRGSVVCHKCDTPLCVNPDHLFVGTQADNLRDGILKGRISVGRVAITTDLARVIGSAPGTQRSVALHFGVDRKTVRRFRRRAAQVTS